jgi:integrase
MSERVHGPYKHGRKYRVREVRGDGEATVVSFESEAEALAYIEAARRTQVGRTCSEAVTEYLTWLKDAPGRGGRARRDSTVKLASWRLRAFLRLDEGDRPAASLTRATMRSLFHKREGEVRVDTLSGELATVRRAVRWWANKGWVDGDPTVGLEVKGSRAAGKPQLRVDEARKLYAVAMNDGWEGAGIAVAMALLMGMRASEITGLVVRDLDDGCRVVVIEKAKTKLGVRRLEVPDELVGRLRDLVAGLLPTAKVFGEGAQRQWLYWHVHRLCKAAGVPVVSPHGLRGTWATVATGVMGTKKAAEALGHQPYVTRSSYAAPGAEQSGQARTVAAALTGGSDASHYRSGDHGQGSSGPVPGPADGVPGAHDGAAPEHVRRGTPVRTDGDVRGPQRADGVVDAGVGRDRPAGLKLDSPAIDVVELPLGTPLDGKFPTAFDLSDVTVN